MYDCASAHRFVIWISCKRADFHNVTDDFTLMIDSLRRHTVSLHIYLVTNLKTDAFH